MLKRCELAQTYAEFRPRADRGVYEVDEEELELGELAQTENECCRRADRNAQEDEEAELPKRTRANIGKRAIQREQRALAGASR